MKQTEKIDTRCTVETPEGIEFSAAVAGPVPRVLAYAIDFLWRALILSVVGILSIFLNKIGIGFWLITTFLLEWFYPVYFELYKNGQTPGKKSLGLRVVNDDFTPVTFSNSCIRNLLRTADFLPFLYTFGLISMVVSRKFQRLGDLAAGTLVIYQLDKRAMDTYDDENIIAKPPTLVLLPEEQRAFSNFVLRSGEITESRQTELANILQPMLGKEGKGALEELKSIGVWLLGKK